MVIVPVGTVSGRTPPPWPIFARQRNGLKPMLVPECLIACAVGLQGAELDKFEKWIINPNEDLDQLKLVPANCIRLENEKIYQENLLRLTDETPPLPCEEEDEKTEITSQEVVQEKLDLSPVAQCSRLLT